MNGASKIWQGPPLVDVSEELVQFLGGDELLALMLTRRGIADVPQARAFLYPDAYTPAAPEKMQDLNRAVRRILRSLEQNERIGIWGDFDADGQTSTSLLVGTLRELGADVCYHVPLRREEGHGVEIVHLERFINAEKPGLIITCDTGIAAFEAGTYARSRGVAWIITDHHHLPPNGLLPQAVARVNPQRAPEDDPLRGLTGVGTAYQLMKALCVLLNRPEAAESQLDLVALGTVADVGELRGENRYLVQRGLQVLRENRRVGLKALMTVARVNPAALNEEHIGFSIAPRMNALGRLEDAGRMVELLTTQDENRASQLALFIDGLNDARKARQEKIQEEAFALVERNPAWLQTMVLIVYHADWEPGVVGIVANALVEKYGRPVILLTGEREGICAGSARSIAGVSLIDALEANKELLQKWGGHTMAAGMSLEIANIESLRKGMHAAVEKQLPGGLPPQALPVEMELALKQATLEFAEMVEKMAPFGAGNPRPVFTSHDVELQSALVFGRDENHRKVLVRDNTGALLELLWWKSADLPLPEGTFDVAYTLHSTTSAGQRALTAQWVDFRQRKDQQAVRVERQPLEVLDWRGLVDELRDVLINDPVAFRRRVSKTDDELLVWREGVSQPAIVGVDRSGLRPVNTLVLYSTPPSQAVLRSLLESSQAKRLVLFCHSLPDWDNARVFLAQLSGMVKYALNQQEGYLPLTRLAAVCCQRESVVARGIELLCAMGQCRVIAEDETVMQVSREGAQADAQAEARLREQLNYLLEETRAFRGYVNRALLEWFEMLNE